VAEGGASAAIKAADMNAKVVMRFIVQDGEGGADLMEGG
jgi:hypothetical protein